MSNTESNTQKQEEENYLGLRAGRSAWYDRSVGIAEAAGSNPAPSTKLLFDKGTFS